MLEVIVEAGGMPARVVWIFTFGRLSSVRCQSTQSLSLSPRVGWQNND